MSKWVNLKRGNDWGVDYWAREPRKNGRSDSSSGIAFSDRERVRVQLLDGTEVEACVSVKERMIEVADHGHTNTVRTQDVTIVVELHGTEATIELKDVKFELDWVLAKEKAE